MTTTSMTTTPLRVQYLKAALRAWRESNPWASEIPWEQIPRRYRLEIEQEAQLTMAKCQPIEKAVGVVPEDERLAA